VTINNPRDARRYNIETIYQTLALADNLDAASNLFLGRELVTPLGFVDDATMEAETRKIMARLNPNFRKFATPGVGAVGRAAAVGRHRAGGLLQRQDPDHGRAHRRARPAGDADGGRTHRRAEAQGLGIFLIDHDVHQVKKLCDRASGDEERPARRRREGRRGDGGRHPRHDHRGQETRTPGGVMFLGLDLGTSGLKGLLIDDAQRVVAEASAPLTVSRPHDGWSEQNPADWIAAAEAVLDRLAAGPGLGAVRGIGLSGHMHGATLLDASDEVLQALHPLERHAEPCGGGGDGRRSGVAARDGQHRVPRLHGAEARLGAEQRARLFRRVAKVLLPKDYLRLWLTGEHVAEMSDAAGTSWLDTGARDWSDDLLARSGLSRAAMPRLVEGSDVSGTLRPNSRGAGGWGRRSSRAARATTRPRPSGWASRGPGRRSCRSAPRACSSRRTTATGRTRRRRCTPSATRSPAHGTRWG
jgi:hypothetical protein